MVFLSIAQKGELTMKCVVLAAGYATRLYPLTKEVPKALLPVAGRRILERILDKVAPIAAIDEVHIVSNHKFSEAFSQWATAFDFPKKLTVLDDGTTGNDNRLGALGDLQFALERIGMEQDLLVLAGDNLFEFALTDFVEYFCQKNCDIIAAHELTDLRRLQGSGIVELASDGQVLSFEEKPDKPRTNWAVPPIYLYQKDTLPLITQYLAEGNNPDAPGNFIPWLISIKPVYAFRFTGERYDIGTLECYQEAQEVFKEKVR